LPDQDPRQAQAVFSLAQLLRHQRREAEARPLIDEAIRRAEALQGAQAATLIEFLDAMRGNGNALMDQKRERAAVDRMLAVAQRNFPGDHPLHARGLIAVGTILLRDHGDDAGERMLREAAAMLRRLDDPGEARAWRMIGWTRNYWERYDLGLAALDEGQQRCRATDPTEAECLAIAAERIGSLVHLKRGAEAIAASAELDAVIAANGALGMDTREMADKARAEAFVAGGRRGEALEIYERLIRTFSERYGAESSIVERLRARRDQIATATGTE
jgi:tetratricopeptide (TPR) repeat protein